MSEALAQSVDRLSRVTGVLGAMIVEAEAGVPVVAEMTAGVESGPVAALASSLYRRTANAASTAGFGVIRTMQLEADHGHVIVSGAGDLLVVVVAERNAQLGLVRLEASRAAEELA
jgi:predicted regulator of Ras-like GTPase activity (Roadblock/LC7/MglB family)